MDLKSPSSFKILPVVQRYLKTHQKGINYWAICPFHKDTSPSLSISPEKNMFKCFSCNVAGDAIFFIMQIEKCNRQEALKKAGEILGIDTSRYISKDNSNLYLVNELISDTYHKYLFNKHNEEKLEYLTKVRGLSIDQVKKYKIGYAPEKDILKPVFGVYLEQKKIKEVDIQKSHIFNLDEPYFKDRFIFPVLDSQQNIVYFSGRGENPRYLNSKTNDSYSKKTSLYNVHNLKELPIYVFEGFIDLIKVDQYFEGNLNGVACMGGTLDKSLFQKLKKYSKELILCFDNDEAGKNFNLDLGKKLIQNGFDVKIVCFSGQKYKDIDEWISNDPEGAKNAVKNPINFFTWWKENNKPKSLEELQILINTLLEILFDGKILRNGIDTGFASTSLYLIFDFYKELEEYDSELKEVVEEKYDSYKKAISQGIVDSSFRKRIFENPEYSNSSGFSKLLSDNANLIFFYKKNLSLLNEYEKWKFPLNKKWHITSEIESFFKSLDDPENNTITWQEPEKQIQDCREFFDKYFSFYMRYLSLLLNFYSKEINLPIEKKVLISLEIKENIRYLTKFCSDFFKVFSKGL